MKHWRDVLLVVILGCVQVHAQSLSFVTCPIVRDTQTIPCWLAEYQGETYYLGIQGGVAQDFYPPQLNHEVLVEGVIAEGPRLMIFRASTAVVIGLGFTAANQLYGLAGSVMPRREAANAMGVVSLGAGLFGYFGPQMLGILRDWTGSFSAGFYMVAIADLVTLGLITILYRMTPNRRTAEGTP